MKMLKISVLGPLQVKLATPIQKQFESNKVRALLTYLVTEMDRPHNREVLAEMLWPESPAVTGLAKLRYTLANLRKVIGDDDANPHYLLVSRENLQFDSLSNYELDAYQFTNLLDTKDVEKLKQGIALYQGDFLSGFPSIESNMFEEWLVLKREHFKELAIGALQLIADYHEHRGEYQQAMPFTRRQTELEPWLEEAHQQLMRLLALDGQRSAALAQYEICRRLLMSELDVEPSNETIELYESIRDGTFEKVSHLLKRVPPAPGEPPFKGLQYFDESDADIFFGREALIAHLMDQMQGREKSRRVRFLAIIGASGSGKSSIIRAGLVPALKRDSRPRLVQIITPTEYPLDSLSSSDIDSITARGRLILIVDQFEELFTLCQNESERKFFIDKLLNAAQEGLAFIVITLRADFYAACEPYENLRRTLSQNQEYIGPMNASELRRAIEEPARVYGWLFEPGLADLLLRDIGADGDRSPEPGALPLLSHALLETWHRRSGRMLILAGYAESGGIHGAIAKTAEWVYTQLSESEQLIARNIFLRLTELGEGMQENRRRVLLSEIIPAYESTSTQGKLIESVLKMLSDARLVTTTEETAEVAHEALIREWDRLHEWLSENREWLRQHQHITKSAQEWELQGGDPGLVYRGTRLVQALEWAKSHLEDLNLLERKFLETSKAIEEKGAAEREEQRQRELEAARKLAESERERAEGQTRAARQLRRRAVYLASLMVLSMILAVTALVQWNTAKRQAHLASVRELAIASINNLDKDAELSILLALEAISESRFAKVPVPSQVQDALHKAIQNSRIQYTLAKHSGDVIAVTYSPDGKLLATASSDKKVILWEVETGKELMTLHGHSLGLEDIAFSPDGRFLATASNDKSVKLWNPLNGQELRSLTGFTDVIWKISFSADSKFLATAGNETVNIWDINTGQSILILEGQHAPVAFSPLGKYLATSGDDGTTQLWDADSWQEYLSLPFAANALAFSPDEERLVTAMEELKVWDVLTGEELMTTTEFNAVVVGVEYSPDGSQLAAGSQDGTVGIWDSQTGKRLFVLAGHAGAVNDVSFSPGCTAPPLAPFEWCGTWLATASRDGTTKVWDVSPAGSRELATLPGFSGNFFDETHLSTNSFISLNEIEIKAWDISLEGTSRWISNSLISHLAPIIAGNSSFDGMFIVTVDMENNVKVWNAKANKEVASFMVDQSSPLAGIAVNASGTQAATVGNDGIAKVWDAATGRELLNLSGFAGDIVGVAFSHDGKLIAISKHDGPVKVWEIATGQEILTLKGHTQPVYVIAFSPDGQRIATGGMDQTARIWDVPNGNNLFNLEGHTASILALAFNREGSLLVTGSHDGTARIWDISNGPQGGEELLTLTGHDGWIDFVSFAPGGKRFATGSIQDGTIRLYLLDIMDLAELAQARLTRSLTLEECQKYLHLATCR